MSFKKKADTPLYASTFIDNRRFILGGGGGQGAHGVANKIYCYGVTPKSVVLLAEKNLPVDSDTITSMCTGKDRTIWVGANIPSNQGFDHLHKVNLAEVSKDEKHIEAAPSESNNAKKIASSSAKKAKDQVFVFEFQDQYDLFKANDITVYQKGTIAVGSMVACVSSYDSGQVSVIDTESGKQTKIEFGAELVDATMNEFDDKEMFVAAASEDQMHIKLLSKPKKSTFPAVLPPSGTKWSKVVATSRTRIVAAASPIRERDTAQLVTIDLKNSKAAITHTVKIANFLGVTAIARSGSKVAVGSSSGDVCVFNAADKGSLVLVRKLRFMHKLPVTSLTLSPNGDSVVSTSLDGSFTVSGDLNTSVNVPYTVAVSVIISVILVAVMIYVSDLILTDSPSVISDAQLFNQGTADSLPSFLTETLDMPTDVAPTAISEIKDDITKSTDKTDVERIVKEL